MVLISRSFRRRFFRPRIIILTLALILSIDAYMLLSHRPSPNRTSTLTPHLASQKIYIASINRNSEYMLRLYWSAALLKLVTQLGPQNVFVSIFESGSQEDTKGALKELEGELTKLGVENRILLGMTTEEQFKELASVPGPDEDRTGWIFTGRNVTGWEVRRIPYLAKLRNKVMEPLLEMEHRRKFDRVLWINDIVFTTEDVTTLLSTRDGDYTAACALDFSKSAETYYDTFALRDSSGFKTSTLTYPYFGSSSSRHALANLQPIPVSTCWNGLISMSASSFYPTPASSFNALARPGLKFRGIPDSLAKLHLEGSECCLIHSDVRNTLQPSEHKGVWLNPNVRVAFNATTYSKVNGGAVIKSSAFDVVDQGPELGKGVWPPNGEKWRGVWANRHARWTGWVRSWSEDKVVRRRVERWIETGKNMKPVEERWEVGMECLVNEMQVLYENGWQHV